MYAVIINKSVSRTVADMELVKWSNEVFQPAQSLSAAQRTAFGVRPIIEVRPTLAKYETHGTYTDVISASKVTRTYSKVTSTIVEAKAYLLSDLSLFAGLKRNLFVGGTSPFEAASWSNKLTEANAYTGVATSAPNLAIEATVRGWALADLVTRVLANAKTLASMEANIAGACGKHTDVIAKLRTIADVQSYDISTGWPI